MANPDAAFGFRPIKRDGSPYNGGTLRCVIATTATAATFIGDPVKLTAAGSIGGYQQVVQAAAGDPVFGVVTAFEANPDALSDQYRKVSTQRYCQVVRATPETYFEIQSDDDTTALAEADVGLNANFIVATGSTQYGVSGIELDSDTANTTSSLDLQIHGLVDRADNLLAGTGSTQKNAIVTFNDYQSKTWRTGV
jgi:hypothetical protein